MSAPGTLSHQSGADAKAMAELAAAYAPFVAELAGLRPPDGIVIDAHTHLGADEDGQTLSPEALIPFVTLVLAHTALADQGMFAHRLADHPNVLGTLQRAGTYVLMGFAAAMSGGRGPDVTRLAPWIAHARSVCRDPDPGPAGPALARIDSALSTAERLLMQPPPLSIVALGLLHAAAVIAATEPAERRDS